MALFFKKQKTISPVARSDRLITRLIDLSPSNIITKIGKISKPNAEALVIANNKFGTISEKKFKEVLEKAGEDLQTEARDLCKKYKGIIDLGDCFSTNSYKMRRIGVKKIYHALVTEYPGGLPTLNSVNKSIRSVFRQAAIDKPKSIAIPALGTGSGQLDKVAIAGITVTIAKENCHKFDIRIVDEDKEFIDAVNRLLERSGHERIK